MEPVTAMVGGMIGGWLGEWATLKVAEALLGGVGCKLNLSDLDKALKAATKEAQAQEAGLFFRCEPDFVPRFLEQFFKGSGLEQLQMPLKKEGTPGVDFLVAAFKKAAEENSRMRGKIDESLVKPWMEVFVRTYFQQTNTYLEFQVAKEDYFEQLANYFDDVKFAGIAVAGQEIEKSEKLAQIFVMPDVVEDVRTRPDTRFEQELLLEETGNRQVDLLREQRQRAQLENRSGRKFLAAQLLSQSQSQKVVLLGAPGSGKTTLLSYFAVMLAQRHTPPTPLTKGGEKNLTLLSKGGEKNVNVLGLAADTDWLPILIRIRDLARCSDEIGILDYARQFAEKTLAVKALPVGFFEYWLEDGRSLILLDGLDEVAEESKRYEVVRRIENFLGQFNQNRAIITSRPAGYKRDFFKTEEFPHYELQPFDNAKIEEFINHWYDSRISDKAEAQRRKDSLKKALSDNERIKLLARNPLLLTIIALIHRYQAVLPKERYKLYSKAVETLLTSWDANKELSNHTVLQYLGLDDLQGLMESLAYWIHTQGSTGDKEGGTLIDRDELIEQLSQFIKTKKQIELRHARNEAKRFVEFIRDRTGLLNEQGKDCYAFVHKTFQEYLFAQEINYQADNEGDFDIILNHIRDYVHDPHWREVLLLLIAQQKPKKAAKAIQAILNNGSEYEQWLHRDLLFAGSCLAENPKDFKVADNALSQKILEALVALEVNDEQGVSWRVRQQVFQVLCSLNETEFEVQAWELLKARADYINDNRLRAYQVALGEKEAVFTILLEKLQDEDSGVRSSAANVLGELGNDDKTVVTALLNRLQDEDSHVRSSATSALIKLGDASKKVVTALVDRLQDEDSDVRSKTTLALVKLGDASDRVISALLDRLKDESADVRFSATITSVKLGNASDRVITALLDRLQDETAGVRFRAAIALGQLDNGSERVVAALLDKLQDDVSKVRVGAAFALRKLGNASETLVSVLLDSLQDKDVDARYNAAIALGELSIGSDAVVNAMLEQLHDEDLFVRPSAVFALGKLGNTSDIVVNALLDCLQNADSTMRSSAVFALGELGKKSNNLVTAVVQWIEQQRDSDYLGDGIDALWDLVVGQ